jgi:hypothetical protein
VLYLSKGMVLKKSTPELLHISHCGTDYILSGVGARLWLDGQFHIKECQDTQQKIHLKQLQDLGLVELSDESGMLAAYYLLARCVICPARPNKLACYQPTGIERKVWKWIARAGLHLSIGELTKLLEDNVPLSPELTGRKNAQALILRLYSDEVAFDTTIDIKMSYAAKRDVTVEAVLGLLQKRRLILI